MNRVLISGGSGLVGARLVEKLQKNGYQVGILSRNRNSSNRTIDHFYWNPSKEEIDKDALKNVDHIIHLAGAGILDKSWTAKRKEQIIDSRVNTGQFLLKKLKEHNIQLKTFISASGVGYYGAITSEKIYTEADSPYNDFVSDVCVQWEKSADLFNNEHIRTVILRIGIVLTRKGGALAKMMQPIKFGFGAPIGSGKQYLPWIHVDDLCDMFIKALEDHKMKGVYNAVAPEHLTNDTFNRETSNVMNRPYWLPAIPSFIIKMIFGDRSSLILNGSRVSSEKIRKTGFVFTYTNLKSALVDLIKK